MVKAGFIIGLLGIPLLIILPVGVGMMGIGMLLVVVGVLTNTAKAGVGAGVGVGKFVAKSATTKPCPECRTRMPSLAVVCLTCGYRLPPVGAGPQWGLPTSVAVPATPAGPLAPPPDVTHLA